MAPSTGFEPVTYRLGGGCSILLSYEGEKPSMLTRSGHTDQAESDAWGDKAPNST